MIRMRGVEGHTTSNQMGFCCATLFPAQGPEVNEEHHEQIIGALTEATYLVLRQHTRKAVGMSCAPIRMAASLHDCRRSSEAVEDRKVATTVLGGPVRGK